MRQGPSNRRVRGRGNNSGRRGNLPNRNQTFDSNGPDVRIRGTAVQVNEKYLALARDATTSGDRVMAESYFQHAEHYHRIIASINEAHTQAQQQSEAGNRQREDGQRNSAQSEDGQRDSGNRGDGSREGGNREAGHRENGHRENVRQRDRDIQPGNAVGNARPSGEQPQMEFGEDPRQDDVRDTQLDLTNGEAVIEVAGVPPVVEPEPAEARPARNGKGAAAAAESDAVEEDAPAPKPRRRGPGRPRKTAAKDAAPAVPEANTDGD